VEQFMDNMKRQSPRNQTRAFDIGNQDKQPSFTFSSNHHDDTTDPEHIKVEDQEVGWPAFEF
jgi:hypothetical protein